MNSRRNGHEIKVSQASAASKGAVGRLVKVISPECRESLNSVRRKRVLTRCTGQRAATVQANGEAPRRLQRKRKQIDP